MMVKVNQVQLLKNLNEVKYPLSKKDLILFAEEKGVDENVLRALKQLPNQQYQTPVEVSAAMGVSIVQNFSHAI
ncbi:hypothetical protein NUACC21_70330 [Scytonema sp. NUACC21]